jgi:SNF2 family DNA or RNA helicase
MLWKHQTEALEFINRRKKGILYAGMGTGKTLAALTWLEQFGGPCLVLTPKSAIPVWKEDAQRFGTKKQPILLNKGTSKDKTVLMRAVNNAIFVVNYETARLLPLRKVRWAAVVADECQRLGTHNSKQTLALTRMQYDVPHKLAMTGTLWHDGPGKLYSIMRWLYPQIDANPNRHPYTRTWGSWQDYLRRFAQTYEVQPGVWVVVSWRNLEQIARDVDKHVLKIEASQVLDLPPVVERTYSANLQGKARRAYTQLAQDRIAEIDDLTALAPHELTKIIRLAQLATNGVLVTDDGEHHELNGLQERLRVFDMLIDGLGGLPCVVFTRFKKDIELLEKRAHNPAFLTGDRNTLEKWRRGDCQILLANIEAGSEGVRLERAHHTIFWSVGYSAASYWQARARTHRAGQEAGTVFYHHIVSSGTIDEEIYKVLRRKNKTQERLDTCV